MADAAATRAEPLLLLPGFMPDAVTFALRLTSALLLAYLVSFSLQLSTASSAGVCVGVVMQPQPGMAMSKAFNRITATCVGLTVSLLLVAAFPQDRTMLLASFAVWMGICSYAASVLRDFRSYGAGLAGYTVAIIAVSGIDSPDDALLTALNRGMAIMVGIASVALVNSVFTSITAQNSLEAGLRRQLAELQGIAAQCLETRTTITDEEHVRRTSAILALRTQATYARAERADGPNLRHAAETMIAALLRMAAAVRAIGRTDPDEPVDPATREYLEAASRAMEANQALPLPDRLPSQPFDAVLTERAAELVQEHRKARACLDAVSTGTMQGLPPLVRLEWDPDRVAAFLNGIRTIVAVCLAAAFCVLGNDANSTLVLVQQAAMLGLLSTQPNPSKASIGFLVAAPIGMLLAAGVEFLLLPQASGFVPFGLAVGPAAFLIGLAYRQEKTAKLGPALLIGFTLLLSPSNMQRFDLANFLNTVLYVMIAILFAFLAFQVILPVDPGRRLFRAAGKIVQSLRQTLLDASGPDQTTALSLSCDRLSQVELWIQARKSPRPVLFGRLCDFVELEAAILRARGGLHELRGSVPDLATNVGRLDRRQNRIDPAALGAATQDVLARSPTDPASVDAAFRAVSGLYASGLLLQRQTRALRRYGIDRR